MGERQLGPAELERFFTRGIFTRGQFIQALVALGMSAGGISALVGSDPVPVEAQVARAKYLVMIVLDAFRPDYVNLTPMPSLMRLTQSGSSYDRAWVGQMVSETPTGHATLSTGAMPKNDGVLGFEWRDPKTRQEVLDGWPPGVLAGRLDRDMQLAGVDSIPHAIKKADPTARAIAISSEKVYAADAMGASASDYVLYHHRTAQSVMPTALPAFSPQSDFFSHPHLQMHYPMAHFTNWDYLSTMLALASLDQFKPRVLMVNLPGPDVYGHPYGGPATPDVMRQVVVGVDRDIARIVHAYQKAGIYNDTLFVVTADHGMVPNSRSVDGAQTKDAVHRAGGDYLFHTGGTAADIYLKNPARAKAVAAEMARLPGVAAAYYQIPQGRNYTYAPAPGLRITRDLDDAYRSLLSTFSGPSAPDVVAPFRENTIGSRVQSAHGDHGGPNWGAQWIPLVISGPGVKPGLVSHFPARLMDVAPTVLRLMGIPARHMDGIVLADTLLAPTSGEIADQYTLATPLLTHQNALIGQSVDNADEDQRAGLRPPPSLPARP